MKLALVLAATAVTGLGLDESSVEFDDSSVEDTTFVSLGDDYYHDKMALAKNEPPSYQDLKARMFGLSDKFTAKVDQVESEATGKVDAIKSEPRYQEMKAKLFGKVDELKSEPKYQEVKARMYGMSLTEDKSLMRNKLAPNVDKYSRLAFSPLGWDFDDDKAFYKEVQDKAFDGMKQPMDRMNRMNSMEKMKSKMMKMMKMKEMMGSKESNPMKSMMKSMMMSNKEGPMMDKRQMMKSMMMGNNMPQQMMGGVMKGRPERMGLMEGGPMGWRGGHGGRMMGHHGGRSDMVWVQVPRSSLHQRPRDFYEEEPKKGINPVLLLLLLKGKDFGKGKLKQLLPLLLLSQLNNNRQQQSRSYYYDTPYMYDDAAFEEPYLYDEPYMYDEPTYMYDKPITAPPNMMMELLKSKLKARLPQPKVADVVEDQTTELSLKDSYLPKWPRPKPQLDDVVTLRQAP